MCLFIEYLHKWVLQYLQVARALLLFVFENLVVLFLFLRYYFCYDNTSLKAFIAVDSNRILDIWECYSCRALVFPGHSLYRCSETLVLRTTGQPDESRKCPEFY